MARRRRSMQRRTTAAKPSNILIALLLLLALYLYQSGALQRWWDGLTGGGATSGPAAPRPSGSTGAVGDIQIFFTTTALVYPDNRDHRPVSPLLQAVIADIDAAHTSVDLAAFDFDIPEITEALLRAKQRGATVRVIIDSENLETPEVSAQTGRLSSRDIPVHFDDREPFMHNKFLVVDSAIAWTGSWNVTTNDTFLGSLQQK